MLFLAILCKEASLAVPNRLNMANNKVKYFKKSEREDSCCREHSKIPGYTGKLHVYKELRGAPDLLHSCIAASAHVFEYSDSRARQK